MYFCTVVHIKTPGKDRLSYRFFVMTKVKNVVGSSRFPAPSGYSSWLDYWEKKTGTKKSICGVSGCSKKELVGAHVQKVNSTDQKWYITPICGDCNKRTDEFDVVWDLVPVPSNS